MADKSKSQRSTRNQKPKYTFEATEASIEIKPCSSASALMEIEAAKQVDIILKKSGTELCAATSTCEKAVVPATEKPGRTIAINLTISEDQIRTWLDVPQTENPKKETKKRVRKTSATPETSSTPKVRSKRAGKHTLTENRKKIVIAKMTKVLSGEKAAEFGSAESIEKLAKSIQVPARHMRKWLGITDDLSQIIANSGLKVRGFESKMEGTEEKEAEIETISLDDENPGEIMEAQNDAGLPVEMVEAEDITQRPDELLEEDVQKGNESPEELVELPKEVKGILDQLLEALKELEDAPEDRCPEQSVEVLKAIEGPGPEDRCREQSVEVVKVIEGPGPKDRSREQSVEVVKVIEGPGPEEKADVPMVIEGPGPEEKADVPMVIEGPGPEEIADVPMVIEGPGPEEKAQIPMVVEVPEEIVNEAESPEEVPQPEAIRQSPVPAIDGETVELVQYESLDDNDEASSTVGEIEMSTSDNLDNASSSSEETGETQIIRTEKIGDAENGNPSEKKEAVVVAEPEVPFQDIAQQQQQSSSSGNSKSDEMDTDIIVSLQNVEKEKTPAPAKRKTCIDDYFPKLKNMRII